MAYSLAFSQATEVMIFVGVKMEEKNYRYLNLQTISERLNIPLPSLKKIVGFLRHEGLLISKTGALGGIMLGKPMQEITLFEIFRAIEGNKPMFKPLTDFDASKFQHREIAEKFLSNLEQTLSISEEAMLNNLRNKVLTDLIK